MGTLMLPSDLDRTPAGVRTPCKLLAITQGKICARRRILPMAKWNKFGLQLEARLQIPWNIGGPGTDA
jgi:hypothetical protein